MGRTCQQQRAMENITKVAVQRSDERPASLRATGGKRDGERTYVFNHDARSHADTHIHVYHHHHLFQFYVVSMLLSSRLQAAFT